MPNFADTVAELEGDTLSELQAVVKRLDRAVASVLGQSARPTSAAHDDGGAARAGCRSLHEGILAALVSHRTPSDLQMLAALLHILRGLRRIEAHRTTIAGIRPVTAPAGSEAPALLELVEGVCALSISGVWLAREAFATRDVELAHEVVRVDGELIRRSSLILRRALDLAEVTGARDWAMSMFVVGCNAERVSTAAVDIAEQTVIVVNGLFREVADAVQVAREPAAAWSAGL